MTELTPAEQAAARGVQFYCSHTGPSSDPESLCGKCDDLARAAVAKARPIIAAEALRDYREKLARAAECFPVWRTAHLMASLDQCAAAWERGDTDAR